MGYVVKHSSVSVNNARKKGNVALGVDADGYDKTSVSGFYAGVAPVPGFHNLVRTSASTDPDFYTLTDLELVNFANSLGGSVSDVTGAKVYLASRNDIMFTDEVPEDIVTEDLIVELDASNISSYPGSGSTIYDLSGNSNNGTISGTPTFNENGYLEFDGSSNYIDLGGNVTLSKNNSTFSGWFYIEDFTTLSGAHTQQARSLAYGPGLHHLALIAAWDGGYGFENDVNSSPYEVNSTNNPPIPASDITSQKWFNFVLSFISGTARGYVNGKLISTVGSPNDLTIRYLGRAANNTNYPDYLYGNMANVKIYNKGLSAGEIAQNYYKSNIVTDGLIFAVDAGNLVSYESGSTSVYDLTGNVSSGSLLNGAYSDGNWFVFDGTNDELEFPHNAVYKNQEISVDFWVQLDYESSGRHVMFTSWYGFTVEISNTSGAITWGLQGLNGQYMGGASLDYGVPTHISCTYNPTTDKQRIYINGELKAEQTASGTISYGSDSLRFSGSWDRTRGRMGFMKIYNKELSKDEVLQNYNAQKSRFLDYLKLGEVETSSEWLKVFRHYTSNGDMFSNTNDWAEAKNTNQGNPRANKYSILDSLDKFRLDGKYTFKLYYPNENITNIWSQTNNPVTDDGSGGVEGYQAISIGSSANSWGGLERRDSRSETFLDGSIYPSAASWWFAVGARSNYPSYPTIPGASTGITEVELWIKYK